MAGVEDLIVAKYGGSVTQSAEGIRKLGDLISRNVHRRVIITSASGELDGGRGNNNGDLRNAYNEVGSRFEANRRISGIIGGLNKIRAELGLASDPEEMDSEIDRLAGSSITSDRLRLLESYLTAKLIAKYTGAHFMDATEIIRVGSDGTIDPFTYSSVGKKLQAVSGLVVIPGSYGLNAYEQVSPIGKGDSDATGAAIARGMGVGRYEIWTDRSGVLAADPSIVPDAKSILRVTYRELHEIGTRRNEVFRPEAVEIIEGAEKLTKMWIRSTFHPKTPGTVIEKNRNIKEGEDVVAVANHGPFQSIEIEQKGMAEKPGVVAPAFDILAALNIPFTHVLTSDDKVSILIHHHQPEIREAQQRAVLLGYLRDGMNHEARIGLGEQSYGSVSVVGEGISSRQSHVSSQLFQQLDAAGIRTVAITSPLNGITISAFVDYTDIREAVKALYQEFIAKKQ